MNGYVSPKLLMYLFLAVGLLIYVKISNPFLKYSSEEFWESASLADVALIPEEALAEGNRNGPVLMWASSVVSDPQIITAIIERGVDVNEREVDFKGTALSAAAYQNPNVTIIDRLIEQGAEVNVVLGLREKTPLLLAAEANTIEVTQSLLSHGADINYRDENGNNAWEVAIRHDNKEVSEFYAQLMDCSFPISSGSDLIKGG